MGYRLGDVRVAAGKRPRKGGLTPLQSTTLHSKSTLARIFTATTNKLTASTSFITTSKSTLTASKAPARLDYPSHRPPKHSTAYPKHPRGIYLRLFVFFRTIISNYPS